MSDPLRTCLLLLMLGAACAGDAPAPKKPKAWEAMDYGPTLGCSLQVGSQYVLRALIIRLEAGRQTYCCYDLETMRMAAAWSGGFIDWKGTIFDGEHHVQPKPVGTMLFADQVGPGWARDGSFADPRPEYRAAYNVPAGGSEATREGQPMPADWVRSKGHYLHGQQVVLSYTVNGCAVLESPATGEDGAVLRTFTIGASASEQRVIVAPATVPCALAAGAAGVALAEDGGHRIVTLAPAQAPRTFVVAVGVDHARVPEPAPLEAATHGGPARWTAAVTTAGRLGGGDGPYVVDTLTPPDDNPWHSWLRFGGMDLFPDGKRAALCTWSGDVWLVDGIDAGLGALSWKRFATGLYQPLGLKIVDGEILCTCRDRIVRLHDLDGDGEADFYESFNSDMHLTRHFHEFMLDLQSDAAGNLYFAKGSTPGRGGPNFDLWSIHNGAFFKLSKDGAKLEVVARGLRAPNGIGVGPHGELVSGDNQGSWVPVCPINRIRPGAFVGIPDGVPGEPKPTRRDDPICWIPYDVDNSSGGQVWVPDGRWGPFAGQMLHLSYGKCSLFSVMTQMVGDVEQGAVARFPLAFDSGIMRARFSPADGQLYVCGLRGWQTNGGRDGAFQRVRWTGKPVHHPLSLTVTRAGIEIAFTSPLDKASVEDAGNWSAQQFNVIWSAKYGSPEMSVADPKKQGRDPVEIRSIRLGDDGRTVTLEIPGLKPVNCLVIKLKIAGADGTAIAREIDATINAMP
jgi:glucose/arabinose dehydrogenase